MAAARLFVRYRKPLTSIRWLDIKVLSVESCKEWSDHNAPRLGASLSFYTLLSLAPLLFVLVAIGGLVFDQATARSEIIRQVHSLAGPAGAKAIETILDSSRHGKHGWLATVIGLVTLVFGASAVLIELRDALNTMWDLPASARTGLQSILKVIRERLFSFALVLAIGFLLLVSLAVNAAILALGSLSENALPAPEPVLHVLSSLVSFVVITALFAAIYKIMPDVQIEWQDVLLGAAVTSLLFTLGKFLIGLYLSKARLASMYGAATSMAVLLLWLYYSSQIFFLGAAFTKVFASRFGSQRKLGAAARPLGSGAAR